MNRDVSNEDDRQQRDAEIHAAFQTMTRNVLKDKANWDSADRLAWEILSAFDRSDAERR